MDKMFPLMAIWEKKTKKKIELLHDVNHNGKTMVKIWEKHAEVEN